MGFDEEDFAKLKPTTPPIDYGGTNAINNIYDDMQTGDFKFDYDIEAVKSYRQQNKTEELIAKFDKMMEVGKNHFKKLKP